MNDYIAAELDTDDYEDANGATVDDDLDCGVSGSDVAVVCLVIGGAFGLLAWALVCVASAYMVGLI